MSIPGSSEAALIEAVYAAVLARAPEKAVEAVADALAADSDPVRVLDDGVMRAMAEVGRRYQVGEFYVSDLLHSADATNAALGVLRPALGHASGKHLGAVVIGVIEGDVHDIGKNLVGVLLEIAGFDVHDMGRNVPAAAFADAAVQVGARLVGVSSLMTTTREGMREVVGDVHARIDGGLVVIGGAAVDADFAAAIGADGYACDAVAALFLVEGLLT